MINITFLVSNIYKCGGVQRVVSLIANKLQETNRYKVSIVSMFKTDCRPFFELNENIIVENIFNEQFSLKKEYFRAIKGLSRYIKQNKIDILIFSGMGYGSIVKIAALNKPNMKIIAWEHQCFFFGKKMGLEWLGKRIAAIFMDAIVVLTKEDYRYYNSNLRKIKRIEQIYNPISEVSQKYQYNIDSKYIISCGSIVAQKGFDYAVEVAEIIFSEYPDWQWHIYGEGSDKRMIEQKIIEKGLQKNLILKGYSTNIEEEYKKYSIYVMTSRHEGFPMVLLEAKINRLPIVSFDCKCGPSELVLDGINGFLIREFNTHEMANKIITLIKNKEKRILFSNNCALEIENLSIENVLKKWEELLYSI